MLHTSSAANLKRISGVYAHEAACPRWHLTLYRPHWDWQLGVGKHAAQAASIVPHRHRQTGYTSVQHRVIFGQFFRRSRSWRLTKSSQAVHGGGASSLARPRKDQRGGRGLAVGWPLQVQLPLPVGHCCLCADGCADGNSEQTLTKGRLMNNHIRTWD